MLNVYVPREQEADWYISFLQDKTQKDLIVSSAVEVEHKREKLVIASEWCDSYIDSLLHSESGRYVETKIFNAPDHVQNALAETSDLYLVLTTRTVYSGVVLEMLKKYVQHRGYSEGLIEIFVTVLQELINNAVIHGNLGLDLYLVDLLRAENFNSENLQKMQEIFSTIQSMLDNESFAFKPVIIRMNCFDESIVLDIQDNGAGFEFEAFKDKYKDTQFVKGMDLVFLMSKDIEYDKETKTMSVILEEPEKHGSVTESQAKDIRLGILTEDRARFKEQKARLLDQGFLSIRHITTDRLLDKEFERSMDSVLILADKKLRDVKKEIGAVKACTVQPECPILYQKSRELDSDILRDLLGCVNDFVDDDMFAYEVANRITTQHALYAARKGFLNFYRGYQSELIQSEKAIQHLEKGNVIYFRGEDGNKKHLMQIHCSETDFEGRDQLEVLGDEVEEVYGNGFSFRVNGNEYLIFLSLQPGLSSILIMSYLGGYVAQLKAQDEDISPEDLLEKIGGFLQKILPVSYDISVCCMRWGANENTVSFGVRGYFNTLRYDFKNDKVESIQLANGLYEAEPDSCLLIGDGAVHLDAGEAGGLMKKVMNLKRKEIEELGLYDENGTNIPYVLLRSYG